jgi:hypothetical protein
MHKSSDFLKSIASVGHGGALGRYLRALRFGAAFVRFAAFAGGGS